MSAPWLLSRNTSARRSTRRSRRPAVERLEDRCVPAVFNVNSTADILNPGPGVVTLRSAIQAANTTSDPAGNFINLTVAGTYKITLAGALEDNNATGDFDILPHANGNLTISNTSGGPVTVDGNQLDRVFDINPGNSATKIKVTMQGFTIRNGVASDPANPDGPTSTGGGIRDQGNADLTLNNMVITANNATADGGGVVMENTVNSSWTLTVNNSTISNNHAGDAGGGIDTDGAGTVVINNTAITGNTDLNQGAGLYVDAIQVGATFVGASATLTGATVSDNQALAGGATASGGGISNAGNGTITLANSTVANNFTGGMGGGFSDENNVGTLVVMNSLFLNNSATMSGGAIQEGAPSTTISNTEFQGNSTSASGGGLFANGATLTVTGSTFVNNTAVTGGGAIELQTTGTGAGASSITNSTLTGNTALNNAAAAGPAATGGGIDAPTGFTGAVTLQNDTINGNVAGNGGGVFWQGAGTFTVAATATALGTQTVTASVTGPDLSPATVTGTASISVLPIIPNARVPSGTPLSAPFANLVTVRTAVVRQRGHRFFRVTLVNNTADIIFGRLVLFGFLPRRFPTGLTFHGAPALAILLTPGGVETLRLPFVRNFFPVVVAGL